MKCAAFPEIFSHKKINSLFLPQESTLEVSEQQYFYLLKTGDPETFL